MEEIKYTIWTFLLDVLISFIPILNIFIGIGMIYELRNIDVTDTYCKRSKFMAYVMIGMFLLECQLFLRVIY